MLTSVFLLHINSNQIELQNRYYLWPLHVVPHTYTRTRIVSNFKRKSIANFLNYLNKTVEILNTAIMCVCSIYRSISTWRWSVVWRTCLHRKCTRIETIFAHCIALTIVLPFWLSCALKSATFTALPFFIGFSYLSIITLVLYRIWIHCM